MGDFEQPWSALAGCAPGTEELLAQELADHGIAGIAACAGGVECRLTAMQLLQLNRSLRVATRLLVRLGQFKAAHLSELSRRAKALPWDAVLQTGQPVRVRAVCHKSRIYHSGAAAQRVAEACGHPLAAGAADEADPSNALQVLVRLERDVCTVSVDASGEPLYHRGYKLETAKAPLRESLAAGLLHLSGWRPGMALIDPMCGSGTLVLEAASWAAGLQPGRLRDFACSTWPCMQGARAPLPPPGVAKPLAPILAFDRDAGAVAATQRNVDRAGVEAWVQVAQQSLTHLKRPDCAPGWLICNPPYGQRIGDVGALTNLYAALGGLMRQELTGWHLGLVTATPRLAKATGLAFTRVSAPLPHGGLKIRLYST